MHLIELDEPELLILWRSICKERIKSSCNWARGGFCKKKKIIISFFFPRTCLSVLAISASFERGTSVTYALQEPYSVMRNQDPKQLPTNKHPDTVRSRENVAFGFLTKHAPALVLSAQSHDQRYMAITLTQNGKSSPVFENSVWNQICTIITAVIKKK